MADKPYDIVTLGESMVLLQPLTERIGPSAHFVPSVGGAESNVAAALARLDLRVRWISRLGNDPFAKIIMSALAGEGVDLSCVEKINGERTAVYFKEDSLFEDPRVYYYRKESAASKWRKEHVRDVWFEDVKHLHITGITLALGEGTREFVVSAMKKASERGLTVSFDPNVRTTLKDPVFWKEAIEDVLPYVDVFMPGRSEAVLLFGNQSDEALIQAGLDHGATIVTMKLGEEGSLTGSKSMLHREKGYPIRTTVDTVGAGDAYAAGFLSVMTAHKINVDDWIPNAAKRANVMGAIATTYKGDWEGSPLLHELNDLLEGRVMELR
ncbi:sugar kinase [Salisediminibacterium selenitireducens]|uniref:PfkB domain protein n=1 Tax=Bacillus selenitireducens (strain ATCC 700615 / DSM 15326 / MLS10) TaxID=439292 RepID=D6XXD9_BACIE|nr:sugar kinase [Salisediminibacterium selenitireducens]ADH97996.1 PfkB domain protein [[Bacillus] selenitireducens MLS10]